MSKEENNSQFDPKRLDKENGLNKKSRGIKDKIDNSSTPSWYILFQGVFDEKFLDEVCNDIERLILESD